MHELHSERMSNTITVRVPEDLAEWLDETARRTGVSKGRIVREELEKARISPRRPFLRLAGTVAGPADVSSRRGFSRR
jgi:predicted transcriptional regulator